MFQSVTPPLASAAATWLPSGPGLVGALRLGGSLFPVGEDVARCPSPDGDPLAPVARGQAFAVAVEGETGAWGPMALKVAHAFAGAVPDSHRPIIIARSQRA